MYNKFVFRQAIHLAGLPAICYVVMRTQNPHNMQRQVYNNLFIMIYSLH